MIYETINPESRNMVRTLWSMRIRSMSLQAPKLKVRFTRDQMRMVQLMYPELEWFLCQYQEFDELDSMWTPKHDSAYYNGLLMGYFGRISAVDDDGTMIMVNNSLGRVVSSEWQWSTANQYWWVDLRAHKPLLIP